MGDNDIGREPPVEVPDENRSFSGCFRASGRVALARWPRRRRAPASQRTRVSEPRAPPHGRGPPRRRRLLVARRLAAGVPERARTGQSLLPDLRARHGERRVEAHLARHRQDDLRVLPARQRRDPLLVDAPRPEVEAVSGRGERVSRLGQGAPLLVGLRRGDGHLRVQREDRRPASG